MLTVDDVTEYLRSSKLLSSDQILCGDYMARSAARRNSNIIVTLGDGSGYVLKQWGLSSPEGAILETTETAFHAWVQSTEGIPAFHNHLPTVIRHDSAQHLLITNFIQSSQTLWGAIGANSKSWSLSQLAIEVGSALGRFCRLQEGRTRNNYVELQKGHKSLPWILRVSRPDPELLAYVSPVQIRTIGVVQSDKALTKSIDRTRGCWSADSIIHGDIRSDNLLFTKMNESPLVILIDWETSQWGDSAWDVAGAIQDIILYWVLSIPIDRASGAPDLFAPTAVPLQIAQEGTRAVWSAYCAARSMKSYGQQQEFLQRVLRYAACRLMQSAFELSIPKAELQPHSVLLLQLASNILNDSDLCQLTLFGIPHAFGE